MNKTGLKNCYFLMFQYYIFKLKNTFLFLLIVFVSHLARPSELFLVKLIDSVGTVVVRMPAKGQYVYGNSEKDLREFSMGVLIGGVERISFDAYTYEELNEYLRLKQKTENIRKKEILKIDEEKRISKYRKLNWPLIIQSDSEICVPEIDFSTRKEWKSHLICSPYQINSLLEKEKFPAEISINSSLLQLTK